MHKSHDHTTGETHYDKFDIDYLRYTEIHNIVSLLVGSMAIMVAWLSGNAIDKVIQSVSFSRIVYTNLEGAVLFFVFLAMIAGMAGNSASASARLAGRRGLFSYVTITAVVVMLLIGYGHLTQNGLFGESLRLVLAGQIICAVFAIPLDFVVNRIFFRNK